jgi:hypothetical protein
MEHDQQPIIGSTLSMIEIGIKNTFEKRIWQLYTSLRYLLWRDMVCRKFFWEIRHRFGNRTFMMTRTKRLRVGVTPRWLKTIQLPSEGLIRIRLTKIRLLKRKYIRLLSAAKANRQRPGARVYRSIRMRARGKTL